MSTRVIRWVNPFIYSQLSLSTKDKCTLPLQPFEDVRAKVKSRGLVFERVKPADSAGHCRVLAMSFASWDSSLIQNLEPQEFSLDITYIKTLYIYEHYLARATLILPFLDLRTDAPLCPRTRRSAFVCHGIQIQLRLRSPFAARLKPGPESHDCRAEDRPRHLNRR